MDYSDTFVSYFWRIVLYFFGGKKLSRRERRKLKSIGMKVENALVLQPEVLSEIMLHDDGAGRSVKVIQNVAHYPPHKNSTAEYLSIGEKKYEKLKENLKKQSIYIYGVFYHSGRNYVEQYIGDTGGESKNGVDVRLIYDDMGVCCFCREITTKSLKVWESSVVF